MKLYRDFTSQEEIDQEYDVQGQVPDMEPIVEFLVSESEKARNELECVLDVRFGPTVDEIVDVFPAEKPGAPILVFIHGGYWRALSSKEFSLVARGLHAHGITVVVDTDGPEIFVGRCDDVDDRRVILLDAASHLEVEGGKSKEEYVERAAIYGIWAEHKHLVLDRSGVTSIRRLGEL